ncbi:MAG: phosphate acetyltransferase [Deltaproteobacteria bacterium]|jgi:phosphate acetyltransferase|nr:phosphate acetyltransferase [Deltaproteobacteria bacterium]
MGKRLFLASTDAAAQRPAAVEAFLSFCGGGCSCGGQVGFFKTVVKDPENNTRLKDLAAKKGLNPRDIYGVSLQEAVTYLNSGREAALIEEVLRRFSQLSAKFDPVLIEGADLEDVAAYVLQGIDAALAANLAAPVVILSGSGACLAASGVRYHRSQSAEVIAVVLTGAATAAEAKAIDILKDVEVIEAKGGDFSGVPPQIAPKVQSFVSTVVTPKRFEYDLIERARSSKMRIVLPEGDDDRILTAADDILRRDFADLSILGDVEAIKKKGAELGLTNLGKAQLIEVKTAPFRKDLVDKFFELRKAKGITPEQADAQLNDRNWFGTMMVKAGLADGMVSGAAGTTADTIRPALSIIKTKPGCSIASSVFLMCMKDRVLVFGDCAINTNPKPDKLAEIAIISAQTAKAFGVEPRVAMLSYSTGTSGTGQDVDDIHEATKIAWESLEKLYPGLALDGPMQFDAALDPRTAKGKMPNSKVAGQATVLIFPTLNAGNIGYKAVQRTSGAVAVGPIIQGLNAPVNDLSRGCTVPDIINTVAITAVQAQAEKGK